MFDERIRELRHSLGINQVEFGKRLNVTKQCISNWENNNIMPSIDMLIRISKTFSVSADYLLGLENRQTLDVSGLSAEQILHLQALINGHADPEETLPLLGHELPENMEFDTMSGFVVDLLGYIPEARENPSVQWENIRFTVLNMEENWISRIKAEILPEQTAEEQPETK